MQRRILISKPHVSAVLSRFGVSICVEGLANHDGATLTSVTVVLEQGEVALSSIATSLRTGLLSPQLAFQMTGRFANNLSKGFALSTTFQPDPRLREGMAALRATFMWSDGVETRSRLVSIDIEVVEPRVFGAAISQKTVGIALAAYNPEPALFRRQIETIRAQSYADWVCVVADDGSRPPFLDEMRKVIGDDQRFVLVRATRNGGFYRNFERAVAALPRDCGYVAFADQDDEWESDKLETLLSALQAGGGELVFSDLAIYGANGQCISPTFWTYRRLEVEDPAAIAVANTVTGMAMLVKASLLRTAMPLPGLPGQAYHDAWFALAALAQSRLQYVARPLVRYVQHGGNHTGAVKRPPAALALAFDFLRRGLIIGLAAPRRSTRPKIGAHLAGLAGWSSTDAVRLSIQMEVLQARVPQDKGRKDVWTVFDALRRRPYAAFSLMPRRAWSDPYRRHVVVGLMLGRAFHTLASAATTLTRNLRRLVSR